ncbi:hypothetical protein BTN49_1717 [Candidatus Enterovibrio escicola]|uniref:Uncharacterized protein n=1 Tax=Candidatus Enterovibrio escicola TaxID=1927127 RepID=A0A2A5T3K9_9GAMM|nr:hypothetical protein BTN49_1717 [Candidatus Enterovibrio escacola]
MTNLMMITDEEINFAQTSINHRSKKCLGFKKYTIIFKEMALVT